MTNARDVHDLIREWTGSPEERRQLEELADRLEEALQAEVPYRPEFREALRAELMAQARRTLLPWYRRPVLWASTVAVAAAAAVVAFGLWQGPSLLGDFGAVPPQAPKVAEGPEQPGSLDSYEHSTIPRLSSNVKIPVVHLPDEVVADDQAQPEPLTGLDLDKGVQVYLVSNPADLDQFRRVAASLGITGQPQQVGDGYLVSSGGKTLTMSADGQIVYADSTAFTHAGAVIDEHGAREAASRFLSRAALPVPDLHPVVTVQPGEQGGHIYQVTYTPRVEGRPVVNGRTVVWMTDRSGVFRAEAHLRAQEQALGLRPVVSPDEAVERARQGGGLFGPGVDLVYVRSVVSGAVYLQPQWRVFGSNEQGQRVVRYIPALADE